MADEPTKPDPNEEAATPDEQPSLDADAELTPTAPDETPASEASEPAPVEELQPVAEPEAAAAEPAAEPVAAAAEELTPEPAAEPVEELTPEPAAESAEELAPEAAEKLTPEPVAEAAASAEEAPAEPAAAPAEPVLAEVTGDEADGNIIDQSELDALAEQLGETAPSPAASGRNTIDQAELDSLAAQLNAAEGGTSTKITTGSGEVVDDPLAAEMAAALAAEQAAAKPAPEPVAAADSGPQVWGAQGMPVSAADAASFAAPEFAEIPASDDPSNIELLDDVNLDIKIELGRTNMYIEDVLRLGVGSVVELDKLAGDPVDIYVNERLIARGEVLVLNDNFCVRINNIHSPIPELDNE